MSSLLLCYRISKGHRDGGVEATQRGVYGEEIAPEPLDDDRADQTSSSSSTPATTTLEPRTLDISIEILHCSRIEVVVG